MEARPVAPPPPPTSWVPLQGPVPVLAFNRASSSWNPAPSRSQDTFQQSSFSATKFRTHPHLLASHVNRAELHNQHRPSGLACCLPNPPERHSRGVGDTTSTRKPWGVSEGPWLPKSTAQFATCGLQPGGVTQGVWSGPAPPSSSPRALPVSFPALFPPYPSAPASPHPFLLTHCCVYVAQEMGLTGESVQGIGLA